MSGFWDPWWPLGIQAKACFSCQLTEPHCVASKTHPFPSADTSPSPTWSAIFPVFSDFFGGILVVMSIPLLCAWCWLHLASVLICSSCYNTTDWVEGVRRYGVRWRPASWLTDSCVFLLHPHMAEGLRELAGVFVMRAPIPFMWDSFKPIHPHDLITSQRPHHFGELGFNICILVRGRHNYSIDGNLSHCPVCMFCLSLLNDKILEGLNYVFFIHYLPYSISKQCLSLLGPHTFIFVDLMLSTLPLTQEMNPLLFRDFPIFWLLFFFPSQVALGTNGTSFPSSQNERGLEVSLMGKLRLP